MRGAVVWAALMLLCVAASTPAHDSGGCDAFTWDVSRELEAMRSQATPLSPSTNPAVSLVRLEEGAHHTALLLPQDSITFAQPPGKKPRAQHPTAGLLFFRSDKGGAYRISLTSRHWIDVLDGARVIESREHQGRGACKLLHKVVEFDLPANRLLTIQLSGDDAATVDIVVTAVRSS